MVKLLKKLEKSEKSLKSCDLLFSKELSIESIGWKSGFYKRKPKKISATGLFESLWQMQAKGKNTLQSWALHLGEYEDNKIHRQSLNERLSSESVELGKLTLARALSLSNKQSSKLTRGVKRLNLGFFNRILIRDSTVQGLPKQLADIFPGTKSGKNQNAMVRLQALYNFTDAVWEDFQIGSYRDNDQKAADCIKGKLLSKDLLIQDLGYFKLDWIKHLLLSQYILTRWFPRAKLYDVNGEELNLLKVLNGKKSIDRTVLVGTKHRLTMRLVARKLSKAKYKKRLKEEQNRDKKHSKSNHDKTYYELLKYEIYLTNIPQSHFNGKAIALLYGLRWHIEILFKSWKSFANFKAMFDKSKIKRERVLFTLYALLTQFVYFNAIIYTYIDKEIKQYTDRQISCLKFMDTMNSLMDKILSITEISQLKYRIPRIINDITYENHTKRKNTMQKYLYIKLLCIVKT